MSIILLCFWPLYWTVDGENELKIKVQYTHTPQSSVVPTIWGLSTHKPYNKLNVTNLFLFFLSFTVLFNAGCNTVTIKQVFTCLK